MVQDDEVPWSRPHWSSPWTFDSGKRRQKQHLWTRNVVPCPTLSMQMLKPIGSWAVASCYGSIVPSVDMRFLQSLEGQSGQPPTWSVLSSAALAASAYFWRHSVSWILTLHAMRLFILHHMCTSRWTGWCERRRIDLSGCFDREAGSDERCNLPSICVKEKRRHGRIDRIFKRWHYFEAVLDRVLQTAKEVGSVNKSKCLGMFCGIAVGLCERMSVILRHELAGYGRGWQRQQATKKSCAWCQQS